MECPTCHKEMPKLKGLDGLNYFECCGHAFVYVGANIGYEFPIAVIILLALAIAIYWF